ncbi:MAG: energy transducer TonB [Acidobacteria bacterium]|jgi:TonB family protein|nr:energy transducer TonB [Acidobacteriota bacterium]
MNRFTLADQLDHAIDSLLAQPEAAPPVVDLEVAEILGIAAELRMLPSPEFKSQLKAELLQGAAGKARTALPTGNGGKAALHETFLPTLLGEGYGGYPLHGGSFATSFVAQAAVLALFLSAGAWVARHTVLVRPQVTATLIEPSEYVLPPAATISGGGGGGGDRDKLPASKGHPPLFAREQITPPVVVVRNEAPKLAVEPTVVGPPSIVFPQTGPMGDPLSSALIPSNGPGSGGGIGSGSGGGVGSGTGPGVGPGTGGGIGGGIYRVGGGVSAPRPIFDPDPEYSEEARKSKYQGTVLLWTVVGPDGLTRDIRIVRSLGMGLDEKAIAAVRTWRFAPAMKDGHPVAVQVSIEVNFRLY